MANHESASQERRKPLLHSVSEQSDYEFKDLIPSEKYRRIQHQE